MWVLRGDGDRKADNVLPLDIAVNATRPSARESVKRRMRESVLTYHDGLSRHRRENATHQNRWVSRRVASHLI
ncbi:MAG: hypothetical protein FJZ00_14395 [Candidatus Sericytochromatia bacterium]|uniref:Uncharacterized protein n=1 Tax=Candidatus Tanganyikabacteria bacterium TaxID=2961651 RepID=A0A937X8J6_9BACT|nr:hypothetical protein [Candidatus Tanganyikabacteria bacterium]